MEDKYFLDKGYHKYEPISVIDSPHIVARFQKCFSDDVGKKYHINIIRWSREYIPVGRRDKHWTPFAYEYEVQVTVGEEEDSIDLKFFASWTLEDVEKYMEEFFEKMKPNYYEKYENN